MFGPFRMGTEELGGAVAQAAAPTINRVWTPMETRVQIRPQSFPNPTPHFFSPVNFLSNLHYPIWLKAKSPKINKKRRTDSSITWLERFLGSWINHEIWIKAWIGWLQTVSTIPHSNVLLKSLTSTQEPGSTGCVSWKHCGKADITGWETQKQSGNQFSRVTYHSTLHLPE